jgi:hypothetical protein
MDEAEWFKKRKRKLAAQVKVKQEAAEMEAI